MVHRSGTCLSLGHFVLSWFDLLTELELFYNYYKFLIGSSLGTVERYFVPCQTATNNSFILFFVRSLSQLKSGFWEMSWCLVLCASDVSFAFSLMG